ncbi:hypothetical protein BC835DRAFT_1263578 [Cytidiella melzeri]|nr:hypothetical protein BC835DRAFT_1263578 [Cytidiella melzeri]
MQSSQLKLLIERAALLVGSSRSQGAATLEDVLRSRLAQFYAHSDGEQIVVALVSLEDVQSQTAREALRLLEHIQLHLAGKARHDSGHTGQEELLGTRDLIHIRTLLSLVFKWAIAPLQRRVCASIPTTGGSRRKIEARIIDLTTVPDDYVCLKDAVTRLVLLVLPTGVQGPPNATVLSSVLLDKHLPDLLMPSLVLGWLPKSLASESVSPLNDLRPMVIRLMHMLPVSKSITALSTILSDPNTLPYVRRSCSYLMSRQLLRRDGVRGLLLALFPDGDLSEENAPLEKFESVGRVLLTVPAGMTASDYFDVVLPQLLTLMSSSFDVPPTQRRVAAFALSRLLLPENNPHHTVTTRTVLSALHKPLLQGTEELTQQQDDSAEDGIHLSPGAALDNLQTFLVNTDPSPTLISATMTPIIPSVYAMSYSLDRIKSADPAMKATLKGLLETWGRLVGNVEGTAALWLIVSGEGGEWKLDVAGNIRPVNSQGTGGSLALFTPNDLQRAEEQGELDVDANILDLRPDPYHFVAFLKSLNRVDIVSDMFVRLLDAYRESKDAKDSDPLRTLLYLQLVVQIHSQLSSGDSSLNVLKKPAHIFSFIKHALETSQQQSQKPVATQRRTSQGLTLEDLRIVEHEEHGEDTDVGDSDDEDGSHPPGADGDEMTSTALDLLLSALEANPDLSTENTPILNDIFLLLDKLARADTSSEALKTLAREARMVLIARLASTSAPSSSKLKSSAEDTSPSNTYQKALKLLQDPLLPVRAHGLLLLRQLVSPRQPNERGGLSTDPGIDRALVPGILSIFLQSLQDDDSYIFLNAVQGLAAMVDGFGKEVLAGLVEIYAKGIDGIGASTWTKQDLNVKTRLGEALGQVIRRCGDALPKYIDQVAPSLIAIVRSPHLPTALRTSSVALLAQCASTSPLAVLPWSTDMFSGMVDLLQLESVQAPQVLPKWKKQPPPAEDDNKGLSASKALRPDYTDFKPTTNDPKIPILRRSALHLLVLLTRACVSQLDGSVGSARVLYALPGELMRRAKSTVSYVAATDEDGVVRVMARETREELDALAEAMLGL